MKEKEIPTVTFMPNEKGVLTSQIVHTTLGKDLVDKKDDEFIAVFVKGTTAIGKHAFQLTNMKIKSFPKGLIKIDEYAFDFCNGIKEITFPAGLKRIEGNAFSNNDLTSITFSAGLLLIDVESGLSLLSLATDQRKQD